MYRVFAEQGFHSERVTFRRRVLDGKVRSDVSSVEQALDPVDLVLRGNTKRCRLAGGWPRNGKAFSHAPIGAFLTANALCVKEDGQGRPVLLIFPTHPPPKP